MRAIIITCLFLAFFCSCSKSDFNDLSGKQYLKGQVILRDTLNGASSSVPMKKMKVFLAKLNLTTSFLSSEQTDDQGRYTFGGIDPAVGYSIYAKTDTGIVRYAGELNYPANSLPYNDSDILELYPSKTEQNGIHLIVQDGNKGRIPGATTWVYTSPVFYNNGTADGKAFEFVTNSFGVANKLRILPGKYYMLIKTRVGNVDLLAQDSIVVPATKIVTSVMTVLATLSKNNGFEVTVLDKYGTPVEGAIVYAYRSKTTFELDKANAKSLFNPLSNAAGLAAQYNIDAALYYLRAVKVIGKDTLRGEDQVHVTNSIVEKKTMQFSQ